jgi:hypothetical protein
MNMLTLLLAVAVLGVIGSLGMGITAMARHGEAGHHTSAQWMTARVLFQALALALVVVALSAG